MSAPKISVVVPTYNQGQFIEQTLASIIGQQWPNLEILVIDGGSTDQTAQVVEKYRGSIAHFVSEKDSGQAEAINKGFRMATGDILCWLNSDDMYLPCTLERIAALLPSTSEPALVYGGCLMFFEQNKRAKGGLTLPYDRAALRAYDYIFQPSSFWTRALWEKSGPLVERYQFVLDWEWYIRASEFCDFQRAPDFLSLYRFHPGHKTSSGDARRRSEILEVIDKYGDQSWKEAYHDVDMQLDHLIRWRARLLRFGLMRYEPLLHWNTFRRHGDKVRVAMSQLHVNV